MRWSRDDAILVLEDDAITIETISIDCIENSKTIHTEFCPRVETVNGVTISIDDDDAATPPAMCEMRDISANRIC